MNSKTITDSLLEFILRSWAEVWISHPYLSSPDKKQAWETLGAEMIEMTRTAPEPESVIHAMNRTLRGFLPEPWTGIYHVQNRHSEHDPLEDTSILENPPVYIDLREPSFSNAFEDVLEFRSCLASYPQETLLVIDCRYFESIPYMDGITRLLAFLPEQILAVESAGRLQQGFVEDANFFYTDETIFYEIYAPFGIRLNNFNPLFASDEQIALLRDTTIQCTFQLLVSPQFAQNYRPELAIIAAAHNAHLSLDASVSCKELPYISSIRFNDYVFSNCPSYLRVDNKTEHSFYTVLDSSTSNEMTLSDKTSDASKWIIALEKLKTAISLFGIPYQSVKTRFASSVSDIQLHVHTGQVTPDYECVKTVLPILKDSHVFRLQPHGSDSQRGYLPAHFGMIDTACYVIGTDDTSLFQLGDRIESFNGISIAELQDRYARSNSLSNQHAGNTLLFNCQRFLDIISGEDVTLDITRKGETMRCTVSPNAPMLTPMVKTSDSVWRKDNVVYFDTARATLDSFLDINFNGLDHLVLDLRDINQTCPVFDLVPYLIREPLEGLLVEYRVRLPGTKYPAYTKPVSSNLVSDQETKYPTDTHKKPESITLVQDAFSMSAGETFILLMRQLDYVTTIGTPTTGANGNVSSIRLPDGSEQYFGCMSVINSRGEDAQGDGISPDIYQNYLPEDLIQGRDSILERAL